MYNPVSRSYGEPHKRPEVQNATIEFIAPSEYMVCWNRVTIVFKFSVARVKISRRNASEGWGWGVGSDSYFLVFWISWCSVVSYMSGCRSTWMVSL